MLLGDAMVSGDEVPDRVCNLPMIGPVTNAFPVGSGYTIRALTQKVTLIGDTCVIGWAGNRLGARMAMLQLSDLARTEAVTPELVAWYLKNLNQDTVNLGTSLLGYVVGDDGPELFANFDHRNRVALEGASAVVEGSTPDFVEKFLRNSGRGRLPGTSSFTPAEYACEYGLQLATYFLASESKGYEQLLRYFGGAYEVATYADRKFKKCDGATYIFWHGYAGEPAQTPAYPALALTTGYRGDDFLVMIQEFIKPPWRHDGAIRTRLSVVRPVHSSTGSVAPLGPADFPSMPNWICHHFAFGDGERLHRMAMVKRPRHDGSDSLSINYRYGAILSIDYKAAFWRDVRAAMTLASSGQSDDDIRP